MRQEINEAAAFVAGLFQPAPGATFTDELAALLASRYGGHWHPEDPERGSGYRCITQSGPDRPEPVVKAALEASASHGSQSRIGRWTVFIDPGCVSARLGDSSDWGTLQEVWGSLPHSASTVATTDLPASDSLPTLTSPAKRSRAIQIVRPDSRNAMLPITPGQHVSIIPPTPMTARPPPVPQPIFAPAPATATVTDPFVRPSSRSSTTSSDGTSSDLGSVFSATSHETLFPAVMRQQPGQGPMKRPLGHHRHTSSVTSTTSSIISRPPSAASGSTVQEHSNGKVGVLGGGVLLGLPSGSTSSSDESSSSAATSTGMVGGAPQRRRREGRGRSRARSANYHAAQQQQAMMAAANRWYGPDAGVVY